MNRKRVRLHLAGGEPSIEGVMLSRPRSRGGYFRMVDVTMLVTPHERHELASRETLVPRERVLAFEVIR